jgi:hypothetical protein
MTAALDDAVHKWCVREPTLNKDEAMTRCKRAFTELVPVAEPDKMSSRKVDGNARKRAKKVDGPSYEPVSAFLYADTALTLCDDLC